MAGFGAAHQYAKYRRFNKRGVRARTRTRYRRPFSGRYKKKNRRTKRRARFSNKKRGLRKAYKKGLYKYITLKRCEKIEAEFFIGTDGTSGDAKILSADTLWIGASRLSQFLMQKAYRNYRFRSVSWKFDNFKVRTILRSTVTEGNPPEEHVTEQILEPSSITMRYLWNKWNDHINPSMKMGEDNRIEEIMQHKCITSCKDKFWGIYKPKNQINLSSADFDNSMSFRGLLNRSKTTSINEDGPPYLSFWFAVESTLPKQFFVPDPPIVRTAKILVDFDCTFYSKFMLFGKNIEYM